MIYRWWPSRESVLVAALLAASDQPSITQSPCSADPDRTRHAAARQAGQPPDNLTDDLLLDRAFGPLWLRLLTRPDTLDATVGHSWGRRRGETRVAVDVVRARNSSRDA